MSTLSIRRLAREIANVRSEVRSLASTQQLQSSSIENGGSLTIRTGNEANGDLQDVVTIGGQPDGSYGYVVHNGPKPPTPVAPNVTAGPGFINVEWSGEFVDAFEPYLDHDYVAVHVTDIPGGLLGASTQKATIRSAAGESVVIQLGTGTWYVSLVAVSQAGVWSDPAPYSAGEAGVPSGVDVVARGMAAEAQNAAEAARIRAEAAEAAAAAASAEANAADAKAIEAQASADVALTTASGKAKVTYSRQRPPHGSVWGVDGKDMELEPDLTEYTPTDGEVWFVRDVDPTWLTEVVHEHWVYNADRQVWIKHELRDEVIASLTAGKIVSGTLNAATTITVGDAETPAVRIGQSSIQVFRPTGDEDGSIAQTINIGGAERDVLLITDPETGSTVAGFDGEGNGIAQSMNITSSMYIGGNQIGDPYNRHDLLFSPARGAIARYMIEGDSGETSTAQLGIAEVTAQCWSLRFYRATFEGNILNTGQGGTHRLFLRGEVGGGTPTLTSPQWTMGFFPNNISAGGHMRDTISTYFFVGGAVDAPVTVRVLATMQRIGGTGNIKFYRDSGATPGYLIIEDLGPLPGFASEVWSDGRMSNGSGTPVSGNNPGTPSTGKTSYTKTYNASWSRTWRGGTVQSSGEVRQGHSSGQLQSAIGFPSQVQSDVSGGKITRMEVYLYANHWYYGSGGTAVIGAHGANSLPASFPSGSATTTATWRSKSGGLWVTLPSSWYEYWESGSSRGITIGNAPPATSSNTYYGRFNGYGMRYAPQLRITYTK